MFLTQLDIGKHRTLDLAIGISITCNLSEGLLRVIMSDTK